VLATLTLLQGIGRLIRTRTDRGMLAVPNPASRGWATDAGSSRRLPPAPITNGVDRVRRFVEGT
jgi:hypothetical protein